MRRDYLTVVVAICLGAGLPAKADLRSGAAREAAEYVMKKFGAETAQEGTEVLSRKIATAAARHGDDAVSAVRRVGPVALTLADEAGEHAPKALSLISRYGDDAVRWVIKRPQGMSLVSRYGDDVAEALIKHKGVAEPVIEELGGPAVKALVAVGPQGGRRLAMMVGDDELSSIGRAPELMGVVARHGDEAMDFIWRNKGPLAVGTALTAFLANPKPFIDGTNQLTSTVAETAVKPVVQETAKAASSLVWTLLVIVIMATAGSMYLAIKYPHVAGRLGKSLIGKWL